MPRCTGGDPLTGARRQCLRDGTPRSSRPLTAAPGRVLSEGGLECGSASLHLADALQDGTELTLWVDSTP